MNRQVYKHKETGKRVYVRNVDGIDCIIHDPETLEEIKTSKTQMRKKYKYLKNESIYRKNIGNIFFKKQVTTTISRMGL